MSLLFRILYAAHARGTHHKLALDALTHLRVPEAEGWRRLFLSYADRYIAGAKAPDDVFKDFKNHVLHPRDGYWGGAPDLVARWYGDLTSALRQEDWSEAAWRAGVLSHYVTDPIHPFHTGQTAAENNIHRAVEWSINRSYDALRAEGLVAHPGLDVSVPEGQDWIVSFMRACADRGNRHYETLIAHYDFTRGVVEPTEGLDLVGRRVVAELLIFASVAFARLLERAISEAGVAPPAVDLTAETVLATLQIPKQLVLKKLTDVRDRRQVEAMYDELVATGKVERNLPEDDRAVSLAFASEVASHPTRVPAPSHPPVVTTPGDSLQERIARALADPPPVTGADAAPAPAPAPDVSTDPIQPKRTEDELAADPVSRAGRRLSATDPVERAPAIGPKTAARLEKVGIATVADLLDADSRATAGKLAVRHITADVVESWQQQARLVMAIDSLNGTHAQLLTLAGYTTADSVARADVADLCAALLKAAGTSEGQRILRDRDGPAEAIVATWIQQAAAA